MTDPLALTVASWYNTQPKLSSPSQINYLIAISIFTLCISLVYLTVFPKFLAQFCHRYAILGVEILTMLFWFAGFIAVAIFMSGQGICRGPVCMSARAGVAIAAFEWYVSFFHVPTQTQFSLFSLPPLLCLSPSFSLPLSPLQGGLRHGTTLRLATIEFWGERGGREG